MEGDVCIVHAIEAFFQSGYDEARLEGLLVYDAGGVQG
jgi:hypothetical protein